LPELPDVEGFRRYLVRYGEGRRIAGVDVLDRAMARNRTPRTLDGALRGRTFTAALRHGKWLCAETGGPLVLMHFGMTGLLKAGHGADDRHPYDRVVFRFDDGELRYRDMRKFGGVWLARDEDERHAVQGPIGPDALAVSRDEFVERLTRRRGEIKPALMDQRTIAGLGNLLVDEILWRIRVNPRRLIGKLSEREIDAFYTTMGEVLRESNRRARVPALDGWLTAVRDRRDARCPRDGTPLRRTQVGGRTSVWCPRDQRR
jgi:formamidopyrimidine-DNA glycosylase